MLKQTLRKCVCCKEMKDKRELYRIVCFQTKVSFDNTGKASGRGAYLCSKCVECDKIKKVTLTRALKTDILDKDYVEIIQGIKNCLQIK